jgi:FG-GAP repeat
MSWLVERVRRPPARQEVVEMRRILVVLVLVLAATVWPATSGVARGSLTTPAAAAGSLQADFNDDGFADLAVGVPFEDAGRISDAGAVNVLYGSAGGLTGVGSQFFTQDSAGVGSAAEPGDFFGFTLATGDFNQDGFADLAVGVPGEDAGRISDAGAVNVLYGSASGLTGVGSQFFTQDSAGVGSAAEAGDSFGFALAAGDFNNDGNDDLAVGAPFEDAGSIFEAGAVNVLPGSAAKLTGVGSQIFTQDTAGVGSAAEGGDFFGLALAAGDFNQDTFDDLAVGVSGEDAGAIFDAGAVNVLYGSAGLLTGVGSQLFTQDSPGVGSAAEDSDFFGDALAAGDFNNDTFADLAVGVPFEDAGTIQAAGAVNALYGSAGKLTGVGSQLFTQDSPGVGSAAEPGDLFGDALAAGDFNNDTFADLAVGASNEAVSAIQGGGAVNVLPGSAGLLAGVGSQLFTQDSPGVGSAAEPFDSFGFALTAADFNNDTFADLAVGVPFEDAGRISDAGAVNALYGSAGLLSGVGSQFLTQDSAGVGSAAEPGDLFGEALAASGPQSATAAPASPASRSGERRTPQRR